MFVRKLSSSAIVGIAIVLTTVAAGSAAPAHGGGFAGHGPSGHFDGHHGFAAHRVFDGHRHFDHRFHGGGVVAPFYWPYYPYVDPGYGYTYEAPAPSYWYYCPSYGAYYPSVQSCPEAWVPVPG